MKATTLKVISELGTNEKSLLVKLPQPLLERLPISDDGCVNAVDMMRLAILAENGDLDGDQLFTPTRANESLSFEELWKVYKLAFDSSIAVNEHRY